MILQIDGCAHKFKTWEAGTGKTEKTPAHPNDRYKIIKLMNYMIVWLPHEAFYP